MERQFLNLKQGSLSVEEYEAEFDRLSQFASTLVLDESSRTKRFVDILKTHIWRAIILFLSQTYAEIIDIAKNLEITYRSTGGTGTDGTGKTLRRGSLPGVTQGILKESTSCSLIADP